MSILNPNNNIRFYISGNKIVKEHITKSVCIDADFQKILFDSNDGGWSEDNDVKPIKAFDNINPDIAFFDTNNDTIIKVVRWIGDLSFNSNAFVRSIDGKERWEPDFSKEDQNAYTWTLRPSEHASFIVIEKFVVPLAGSQPQLSQASLLYAEKDADDPTIIHTFAPPFPNVYENGAICLGSYEVSKHLLSLDAKETVRQTARLLDNGWNQDLYRHYPLYSGPLMENSFFGKILPNIHKITDHNFLRTTDSTEIKVINYLSNKNTLTK